MYIYQLNVHLSSKCTSLSHPSFDCEPGVMWLLRIAGGKRGGMVIKASLQLIDSYIVSAIIALYLAIYQLVHFYFICNDVFVLHYVLNKLTPFCIRKRHISRQNHMTELINHMT